MILLADTRGRICRCACWASISCTIYSSWHWHALPAPGVLAANASDPVLVPFCRRLLGLFALDRGGLRFAAQGIFALHQTRTRVPRPAILAAVARLASLAGLAVLRRTPGSR